MRRFAHYDYWDDKVRRSILVDSGADLLMFGMGERSVVEIADAMDAGIHIKDVAYVPGTCYLTHSLEEVADVEEIPSFETVCTDKDAYGRAFLRQQQETDGIRGKRLAQKHGASYVVVNPPSAPLNTREMDEVYALPHIPESRTPAIPSISQRSTRSPFSITSCRGCFGACSFCALTYRQGRPIQVRSHDSILEEAEAITHQEGFKGYTHDVGGPTANFRQPSRKDQLKRGVCKNRQCLSPKM